MANIDLSTQNSDESASSVDLRAKSKAENSGNREPGKKKRFKGWYVSCLSAIIILGLVIGIKSYKAKNNCDDCISNLEAFQKAIRSYANMYEKDMGSYVSAEDLIGPGKFIEEMPECPAGGSYTILKELPQGDVPWATCSLSESDGHHPPTTAGW